MENCRRMTIIKKLSGKLVCLFIRNHDWGKCTYQPLANNCIQARTCHRCGKIISKMIKHDWDEWEYKSSDACIQVRICRRCGKQEEKRHAWSNWKEVSSNSCVQSRVCNKCGYQETREKHDWSGWEYEIWDYDTDWYERKCRRCGETEKK